MEKALSKDNLVLVLKGSVQIYIDEKEKEIIMSFITTGRKTFELRNRLIVSDSILYIVPAKDVEEAMYQRRGWVKWDCGHWRPRNENKCGTCYYL